MSENGHYMSSNKNPATATCLVDSLNTNSIALKSASELESTKPEFQRDIFVRQILARCAEYARAAATLGNGNNAASISIIARATLENLILILWVVISEENAEELKKAPIAELKRAARINLQSGKARIINRDTGEDATDKFLLDSFINLPKRNSVENRAKDVDVLDLYNIFYRFMSLDTHGHVIGGSDIFDLSIMHMQGMSALTIAVGHAGTLWLLHRKRVDNKTLINLLGLK
jgi:Family of unknown function (DUF5677)